MTDTEDKYLDDEFYIALTSDHAFDEYDTIGHNLPEENPGRGRDTHIVGEQPPVDGWVTFYDPELLEDGEPYKHGTFPFRDKNRDGLWFARPDADEWHRSPIWKWTNFGQPLNEMTLKPSIGMGSGELNFHCYIRGGEIEWL